MTSDQGGAAVLTFAQMTVNDHKIVSDAMFTLSCRTNFILRMIMDALDKDCMSMQGNESSERRCDLCRLMCDYVLVDHAPGRGPVGSISTVDRIVRAAVRQHNKCAMLYVMFVALALKRKEMVEMLTMVDPVTGIPSVAERNILDSYCLELAGHLNDNILPMKRAAPDGRMELYITKIGVSGASSEGSGGGGSGKVDDLFGGLFLSTTPSMRGAATADTARHQQVVQAPLRFVHLAIQRAFEVFPHDNELGWPPFLAAPGPEWFHDLLVDVRTRYPDMSLDVAILRIGEVARREIELRGEGGTTLPPPLVP